ncbi:MAG: hypothetical protein WBR33_25440 [Pseudonocardiaceae bacterium]
MCDIDYELPDMVELGDSSVGHKTAASARRAPNRQIPSATIQVSMNNPTMKKPTHDQRPAMIAGTE